MRTRTGHILTALLSVLLLASCGERRQSAADGPKAREFPPSPLAPSMVTDPLERGGYVAAHFWDAFLSGSYPCDTALVNGVPREEVESALGKFVTIIETVCDRSAALKAMDGFFLKVNGFQIDNPSSDVYGFFEEMVPKYLYDPNSPVRDEDLYLPYLRGMLSSGFTKKEMRPAYSRDALMCSLNQVGSKAADISFTDINGRRRTLYGVEAPRVLLFFSNPGCPNCEEVISSLTGNARIGDKVASGRLAVVNLYIDLEIDKWKALAGEYPKSWINGYDQDYSIRKDLTYCVRAIPSIYVLDKEKRVVMKDAPVEKVIPYLENI